MGSRGWRDLSWPSCSAATGSGTAWDLPPGRGTPQLELIRRAVLTISHGGLNTALESLAQGVPMVVLPVTYDQPGVGVRVERAAAGRSIPVGRLTVERLRDAVREVLGDRAFRRRAGILRSEIQAAEGLNRAADLIGAAFGDPSPPEDAPTVSAGRGGRTQRSSVGRNSTEER